MRESQPPNKTDIEKKEKEKRGKYYFYSGVL